MAMTVNEIYLGALSLLAESAFSGDTDDYAERAPYLAAAFCTEAQDTDDAMRAALGEPEAADFNAVHIPLDDSFPLLDRFAPAACLYIAAMLVIDEDEELSDRLYDRYSDCMSRICESVPSIPQTVTDVYYFK
ncbi:MAG: hypothetical protein IJY08_05590 [Clostridia bacterium]|nr:hypothetical protein [Clostridia bacterium]